MYDARSTTKTLCDLDKEFHQSFTFALEQLIKTSSTKQKQKVNTQRLGKVCLVGSDYSLARTGVSKNVYKTALAQLNVVFPGTDQPPLFLSFTHTHTRTHHIRGMHRSGVCVRDIVQQLQLHSTTPTLRESVRPVEMLFVLRHSRPRTPRAHASFRAEGGWFFYKLRTVRHAHTHTYGGGGNKELHQGQRSRSGTVEF